MGSSGSRDSIPRCRKDLPARYHTTVRKRHTAYMPIKKSNRSWPKVYDMSLQQWLLHVLILRGLPEHSDCCWTKDKPPSTLGSIQLMPTTSTVLPFIFFTNSRRPLKKFIALVIYPYRQLRHHKVVITLILLCLERPQLLTPGFPNT